LVEADKEEEHLVTLGLGPGQADGQQLDDEPGRDTSSGGAAGAAVGGGGAAVDPTQSSTQELLRRRQKRRARRRRARQRVMRGTGGGGGGAGGAGKGGAAAGAAGAAPVASATGAGSVGVVGVRQQEESITMDGPTPSTKPGPTTSAPTTTTATTSTTTTTSSSSQSPAAGLPAQPAATAPSPVQQPAGVPSQAAFAHLLPNPAPTRWLQYSGRAPVGLLLANAASAYGGRRDVMEKNWMPLVWRGRLYVVTSLVPHRVARVWPNGTVVTRYETDSSEWWSGADHTCVAVLAALAPPPAASHGLSDTPAGACLISNLKEDRLFQAGWLSVQAYC
jgi:hypothetical protein